jgi:transcriptional regulator with XRE-family HTH domain
MTFGEFCKNKRIEQKLTLRKFCEDHGYDPGNISKIENGIFPPFQAEDKLEDYAKALKLKKGMDDYVEFFNLASAENRTFQPRNISSKEVISRLPVLFRTLDNKSLTAEKLDQIIKIVQGE